MAPPPARRRRLGVGQLVDARDRLTQVALLTHGLDKSSRRTTLTVNRGSNQAGLDPLLYLLPRPRKSQVLDEIAVAHLKLSHEPEYGLRWRLVHALHTIAREECQAIIRLPNLRHQNSPRSGASITS